VAKGFIAHDAPALEAEVKRFQELVAYEPVLTGPST
jgi:hypothetical protein